MAEGESYSILTNRSSVMMTTYEFKIKDNCLPGPPNLIRRRSFAQYIGFKLGGNFSYEPEDLLDNEGVCSLSPATQQILRERVFHDLNPRDIVDYHCHIVGHGDSGSQCHMHHTLTSWWYPLRRLKSHIFMSAAQVVDEQGGDIQYISRLVRLIKHFVPAGIINPSMTGFIHGRYNMLPFDAFYDPNTGERDMNRTTMYVPNEYSIQLATEFPELFNPVGSVNPYRHDALDILEQLSQHGVNIIKWLPNSMGINPSDEKCIPFYNKIKELNMILLVHCGEEHTVDAAYIDNRLGNPLLLRRALDCGVKVITAHCATEGYAVDIDNDNTSVPCFELWLRLMREEKYKGLLFGDISAVCAVLRVPYLQQLLENTDLHDRLVYGSDYPVPAINVVVHTSRLQRFGLITSEEKACLDELYHYNCLLFDVASKRLLRGSGGEQFPVQVFKNHPLLPTKTTVDD